MSFIRRLTKHVAGAGLALQLSLPHHPTVYYLPGDETSLLTLRLNAEPAARAWLIFGSWL